VFGVCQGWQFLFFVKKGSKLNDSFMYRLINSYFSGVKVKKSPHIFDIHLHHLLNNGADLNSVKNY
jgi:integrase/recombinase XerC